MEDQPVLQHDELCSEREELAGVRGLQLRRGGVSTRTPSKRWNIVAQVAHYQNHPLMSSSAPLKLGLGFGVWDLEFRVEG
jgi:hypothetical protein